MTIHIGSPNWVNDLMELTRPLGTDFWSDFIQAGKAELDEFIEALRSIAQEIEEDPQFVLKAPYSTRVTRLDEVTAARKPLLRWKPK